MSVTIPDSVTSIGDSTFYGCSGLTSVTIPGSVTSIGLMAFERCSGLTSVTIPDGVTSIGESAFSGCSGLMSVTIPDSVTSIGRDAFYGCSCLTSVTIGNGVTSIGWYAFYGCSGLTSVTIPDSVTSIGSSAFSGCRGLTSVTIGNGVTSIGGSAFYGCTGLTSVTIPDSVTSIGSSAFSGCGGLAKIIFEGSAPTIGSLSFSGVDNTCYIYVRRDSQGWGVTIPGRWQGLSIDYFVHVVTFDANGGDCATGEIRADDNKPIGELPLPTRFGYAFKGWWSAREGGVEITSETVVTNDLSLFAHWGQYVVPSPIITPSDRSVFYDESCQVTISCGFEGAAIYYSEDGTTPKIEDDYLYEAPFEITDTTTIRAVAVFEDVKSAYITATIVRKTLQESIEASGIVVGTDSPVPWRAVVTESAKIGESCARSGNIGNRSSTWMSASVSGAGTLSFWNKVSCEHDEDNAFSWDRLMVYTNDVEVVEWRMDGETDWTLREVSFEGGENTVKWVYYKDKSGVDGEDCAWVDGVTWTPSGAAAGVSVEVNGAAVEFETAVDGKTRTATVAAGTAAEDIKVFVGGVDVTAGFKVAVEGTTASVVLKEPYETARSEIAPYQENDDGTTVTLNVEVVPGLYYAADSAATIEALKRPGAAEPAKAGDAVVAPKQEGAQGFYKVWVSDAPIEAE